MLVLTRKLGERIVVADNIVVTVLQIEGGRVRLGIQAPPEIRIVRQELQARAQQQALTTTPEPAG